MSKGLNTYETNMSKLTKLIIMAHAIMNLLNEKEAHDLNFKFLNLLEKEGIQKEKDLLLEGKCVRKIRKLNHEVGTKIVHLSYVKL